MPASRAFTLIYRHACARGWQPIIQTHSRTCAFTPIMQMPASCAVTQIHAKDCQPRVDSHSCKCHKARESLPITDIPHAAPSFPFIHSCQSHIQSHADFGPAHLHLRFSRICNCGLPIDGHIDDARQNVEEKGTWSEQLNTELLTRDSFGQIELDSHGSKRAHVCTLAHLYFVF